MLARLDSLFMSLAFRLAEFEKNFEWCAVLHERPDFHEGINKGSVSRGHLNVILLRKLPSYPYYIAARASFRNASKLVGGHSGSREAFVAFKRHGLNIVQADYNPSLNGHCSPIFV